MIIDILRLPTRNSEEPSFSLLPNKEDGWKVMFRLTLDPNRFVRRHAAEAPVSIFALLPDKEDGWKVLIRLAQDRDSGVRRHAAEALVSSFALLPEKERSWKVLIRLIQDRDSNVRRHAAEVLVSTFALLPDKEMGWQDLIRLTQDQDSGVRGSAARALGSSFALLPDKDKGWQDLIRLAQDQDIDVRGGAAEALGSSFALLPDKDKGWQDLIRLAQDQDSDMRWGAVEVLISSFSHIPDMEDGWQVLLRLTQDLDGFVRRGAVEALVSSFPVLPDREGGWQVLLRLTQDPDIDVRLSAAEALGSSFALLSDKEGGWQDLLKLAQDQDIDVRWGAAEAISSFFSHIPDKEDGWRVLLRLTQDHDNFVRWSAIEALGSCFSHIPDKEDGWRDLLRLAQDSDSDMRWGAANALGSSFSLLPNKEDGWQVLLRLTQDLDSVVRMHAYHSLGRASIYRASESFEKNVIRAELEAAVEFFERSSKEESFSNPASFCLPFYRSYLALTFQGASDADVQRYLDEAKEAVGSSENKKELLGAVENLAKALEETQKLKKKSREQIQSDLKAYRWYCDRAAEHMAAVEEKAPGAVKLLKKCNPIIKERIKATIEEIQKTAREICQVTRGSGTKYEAPGVRINQETKSLSSEDPIKAFKSSTRIASILREFCSLLPRDKRGHACEIVDEIETEQELSGRLSKIELALTYLQPNITLAAYESTTNSKLEEMHSDIKLMDKKVNTIIFNLSNISFSSGDIIKNLSAMRTQLNSIAEFEKSFSLSQSASENPSPPNESQIELGNLIDAKVLELEEILKTKTTKEDNQAILDKLESLKPSAGFEWLGRTSDLIAIFDAVMRLFRYLNDSGLL